MGKIIEFPKVDEPSIDIELTDDYLITVNNLSDFIKELPISHTENEKLIKLVLDQTSQAKKDAFMQGFELGAKLAKDVAK